MSVNVLCILNTWVNFVVDTTPLKGNTPLHSRHSTKILDIMLTISNFGTTYH